MPWRRTEALDKLVQFANCYMPTKASKAKAFLSRRRHSVISMPALRSHSNEGFHPTESDAAATALRPSNWRIPAVDDQHRQRTTTTAGMWRPEPATMMRCQLHEFFVPEAFLPDCRHSYASVEPPKVSISTSYLARVTRSRGVAHCGEDAFDCKFMHRQACRPGQSRVCVEEEMP
jgi:hypothetical protein